MGEIFNRNFNVTWITNFFIFLIFYAMIAIFPIIMLSEYKSTSFQSGLSIGLFLFFAVLARAISSQIVDKINKKKLLIICIIFYLLFTFLYLIINNVTAILVIRSLHGATFGISTNVTGAIVAQSIRDERKGEGIGYFALSYNTAMFIGPFIGLTFINSLNTLFTILSILSFLSLIFSLFIKLNVPTNAEKIKLTWKIIETKAIVPAITAMMLAFTFSGFLTYISSYAEHLGFIKAASYFYMIYAIFMILSRPISGKIFDSYSPKFVLFPAIVIYIIGLLNLSVTTNVVQFLISAVLFGISFGNMTSSLQALCIKSTTPDKAGLANSTYLLFFDFGVGLGSIILSLISNSFGFNNMYLFTSLIAVLSIVGMLKIKLKPKVA